MYTVGPMNARKKWPIPSFGPIRLFSTHQLLLGLIFVSIQPGLWASPAVIGLGPYGRCHCCLFEWLADGEARP